MTIIRPQHTIKTFYKFLVLFGVPVVIELVWLIVLVNQTVSFKHEVSKLGEDVHLIQNQNAELRDRITKLFDGLDATTFALDYGLIEEKNPEYLEIPTQWVSVTRSF